MKGSQWHPPPSTPHSLTTYNHIRNQVSPRRSIIPVASRPRVTAPGTKEYLIRKNKGVKARQGEHLWSNADGTGHVALHKGCYDDAIYVKRNEMWLVVHNVFSGLNREGVKLFNLYRARAKHGTDRTDYVANDKGAYDVHSFAPHWAQLLSAAIVKGDARRALHTVDRCRDDCLRSSARRVLADLRPQPLPATPRPAACARPLECPARP